MNIKKEVLIVTLIALCISVPTTIVTDLALDLKGKALLAGIFLSTILPLIIAPPLAYKYASMAKELKELNEKLEQLVRIDELTQILNRRGFFQIALEKFKTVKRYNIPFSVILLDIDHFKRINDTYGHTVGDKVIAEMALILKNNLRESDAIGRFGGEEFIIACSHTNFDQAVLLVEKIQNLVRKHFIHYRDRKIKFTVSIGFLTLENPAKRRLDFEKIIHLTDKALYLAKEIRNSAVGIRL